MYAPDALSAVVEDFTQFSGTAKAFCGQRKPKNQMPCIQPVQRAAIFIPASIGPGVSLPKKLFIYL